MGNKGQRKEKNDENLCQNGKNEYLCSRYYEIMA